MRQVEYTEKVEEKKLLWLLFFSKQNSTMTKRNELRNTHTHTHFGSLLEKRFRVRVNFKQSFSLCVCMQNVHSFLLPTFIWEVPFLPFMVVYFAHMYCTYTHSCLLDQRCNWTYAKWVCVYRKYDVACSTPGYVAIMASMTAIRDAIMCVWACLQWVWTVPWLLLHGGEECAGARICKTHNIRDVYTRDCRKLLFCRTLHILFPSASNTYYIFNTRP